MTEKMTPAKKDAEFGLISRILLKPSQMSRIADRVKHEHFYYDEMASIYEAMKAVYQRGKLPTIPNVADELIRREARDAMSDVDWELQKYKRDLDERVNGSLEDYADLIIQAARNRRLIDAAKAIVDAAYHEDENSVELAEQLIMAIAMDSSDVAASSMSDMLDSYKLELDQRIKDRKEGRVYGVRTGFRDVDRMIGTFRPGSLNILGALTSVGKTAFALNVAFNIIKHSGGRVLFFSLEMTKSELMQRLVAMESHIDQIHLRDGETTPDEYEEAITAIKSLRPLDFNATDNAYRMDTIRSVARAMHMRKSLDLIVVDYLQMVDIPPAERGSKQKATYEEIGEISKGLKRLSQELNVPTLALAQLSKEAARGEKPDLSHIAGAYQVARDSDTCSLLYVTQENVEKRNACQPYAVNYIVAKERNGRVGETSVMFLPTQTRFADVEY